MTELGWTDAFRALAAEISAIQQLCKGPAAAGLLRRGSELRLTGYQEQRVGAIQPGRGQGQDCNVTTMLIPDYN